MTLLFLSRALVGFQEWLLLESSLESSIVIR